MARERKKWDDRNEDDKNGVLNKMLIDWVIIKIYIIDGEREKEYRGERKKDDGKKDDNNRVLNVELIDWATIKIYTIGGERERKK